MVTFTENCIKYKNIMLNDSLEVYKNSLGDKLDIEDEGFYEVNNPRYEIAIHINSILKANAKYFQEFILSNNKYENKDLCKKIHKMSSEVSSEDISLLINMAVFYIDFSLYNNINVTEENFRSVMDNNLNEQIELKKILTIEAEKLIKHIDTHYLEYFSSNQNEIMSTTCSIDLKEENDALLIGNLRDSNVQE